MSESPLRILMVCPQYRPIVGGYEHAAERLARSLVARGHAVTVYAERRCVDWPTYESHDGVVIRRWPCRFKKRLHMATSLLGLSMSLIRFGMRADVWHIHHPGLHAALMIMLAAVVRKPVVVKLTSTGSRGIGLTLSSLPMGRMVGRLHVHAAAVVATSRELVGEALQLGVAQRRIRILGNGVDTARFRIASSEEKASLQLRLSGVASRVAISLGRLEPPKNLECLLEAWHRVVDRTGSTWQLWIVGDGSERERLLHTAARLGIIESVKLWGLQTNPEEWLRAGDLFVQSSDYEGLSNTMLEAMATGLPVVVTDVSGARDCVECSGAGHVVPRRDPMRLAEAVIDLSRSECDRRRRGFLARQFVLNKYATDLVATSYEAMYRTLCGRSGGTDRVGTVRDDC